MLRVALVMSLHWRTVKDSLYQKSLNSRKARKNSDIAIFVAFICEQSFSPLYSSAIATGKLSTGFSYYVMLIDFNNFIPSLMTRLGNITTGYNRVSHRAGILHRLRLPSNLLFTTTMC